MIALPLLRLLAWVLYFLPAPVRIGLGNGLGRLIGATGFRARVIEENLRHAFPDDPASRARVGREFREHLGNLILEILFVFGPMKRFVLSHSEIRGIEHWQRAVTPEQVTESFGGGAEIQPPTN
jgi:lauroyl/myristoyl acyltransferase